eukprot:g16382.t4
MSLAVFGRVRLSLALKTVATGSGTIMEVGLFVSTEDLNGAGFAGPCRAGATAELITSKRKNELTTSRQDPRPLQAAQEPLLAQAGPFFELQNIDLQVEAGSTTAIISQEGQGKSSLLMAILGEMSMKSGHFSGSSAPIGGQAPVVPETAISARHILLEACTIGGRSPWLFAGSVRSNVLFGLEMHQAIYDGVLEACALRLDLQTMPCGDMTEIAAGGSTISGGQRARVGLARAVYRAALEQEARRVPLVVLDDPFCALDKEVATQVCQAVLSPSEGLLRHSTVLVAAAALRIRCPETAGIIPLAWSFQTENHGIQASEEY